MDTEYHPQVPGRLAGPYAPLADLELLLGQLQNGRDCPEKERAISEIESWISLRKQGGHSPAL